MFEPVAILGATPLATALGVRLARCNWPVAGIWDPDHERALVASLHIGCCAFPEPLEPLSQAGWVLLGVRVEGELPAGATVVGLEPGLAALSVSLVGDLKSPDQDLSGRLFRTAGERSKLLPLLDGLGLKEAPPGE